VESLAGSTDSDEFWRDGEACDGAEELGEMLCPKPTWGVDSMMACAGYGVGCPAGRRHNVTNEMGMLFKCCNCKDDKRCWYTYQDGSVCVLRPALKSFTCRL
jgi:hypothetical protein